MHDDDPSQWRRPPALPAGALNVLRWICAGRRLWQDDVAPAIVEALVSAGLAELEQRHYQARGMKKAKWRSALVATDAGRERVKEMGNG